MKYFSLNELCRSATAKRYGIDNTPTKEVEANLRLLVEKVLDPLRERWGAPIIVDSGYRCKKLNKIVGGEPTSQHLIGQAADIRTLNDRVSDNKNLFQLIVHMNLPYDQLIDEYGYNWIHVSYGPRNRRMIFHKR